MRRVSHSRAGSKASCASTSPEMICQIANLREKKIRPAMESFDTLVSDIALLLHKGGVISEHFRLLIWCSTYDKLTPPPPPLKFATFNSEKTFSLSHSVYQKDIDYSMISIRMSLQIFAQVGKCNRATTLKKYLSTAWDSSCCNLMYISHLIPGRIREIWWYKVARVHIPIRLRTAATKSHGFPHLRTSCSLDTASPSGVAPSTHLPFTNAFTSTRHSFLARCAREIGQFLRF